MRPLFVAASLVFVLSCGGSSSETPPPLEPDPEALAGRTPPSSAEPAKPASSAQPQSDGASPFEIEPRYPGTTEAEPRRKRPVQTWGGRRPPPPQLAPAP